MMRNLVPALDTFVRYHRNLGYSDFVILIDDPNDPDVARAEQLTGVIPIPVSFTLQFVVTIGLNKSIGTEKILVMSESTKTFVKVALIWVSMLETRLFPEIWRRPEKFIEIE